MKVKKEAESQASSAPKLEDLFRTDKAVDDDDLAKALMGKVFLSQGSPSRVFLERGFMAVPAPSKLIAVGLALHVLHRKGLVKDEDLAKPAEWYAEQIQDKPKYVLEQLSKLKSKDYLDRTEMGYRIPVWAIRKALQLIS